MLFFLNLAGHDSLNSMLMFVKSDSKELNCYKIKDYEWVRVMVFKSAFAVVPTDKICGRNLSDHSGYCVINRMITKIPLDMNSIFMKLYVT